MAAPVLIVSTDDNPCPRVEVRSDALPAGAVSVNVWRSLPAGRESLVRGAIGKAVSGVLSVVDFEAPLDVDVTYRVQSFDGAGVELAWSDATTTRLISPVWGDGQARMLVHNPLDPRSAMWVRLAEGSASSISRPIVGEVTYGYGSRLGSLRTSGRRGLSGVPLVVATDTEDEASRFDALFGTPDLPRLPILCVRIPDAMRRTRLPVVWFAAVLDPLSEPHPDTDVVVWRMVADQVESPVPALVMPLLRRVDVDAYYATRAAVAVDNATRAAVDRRYDIAGSGGV